jgi:hypothetical protein
MNSVLNLYESPGTFRTKKRYGRDAISDACDQIQRVEMLFEGENPQDDRSDIPASAPSCMPNRQNNNVSTNDVDTSSCYNYSDHFDPCQDYSVEKTRLYSGDYEQRSVDDPEYSECWSNTRAGSVARLHSDRDRNEYVGGCCGGGGESTSGGCCGGGGGISSGGCSSSSSTHKKCPTRGDFGARTNAELDLFHSLPQHVKKVRNFLHGFFFQKTRASLQKISSVNVQIIIKDVVNSYRDD